MDPPPVDRSVSGGVLHVAIRIKASLCCPMGLGAPVGVGYYSGITRSVEAAGAAPVTCFGRDVTLMGTPGPDVIRGTAERDTIWGGRGDDLILGLAGDDQICGGPGEDRLKPGMGYDESSGGAGDDHISSPDADRGMGGGPGDDLLRNDVLVMGTRFTGDVSSKMNGRAGADRMYGSTFGGRHHDQMHGHDGRDVLVAGGGGRPESSAETTVSARVGANRRRGRR